LSFLSVKMALSCYKTTLLICVLLDLFVSRPSSSTRTYNFEQKDFCQDVFRRRYIGTCPYGPYSERKSQRCRNYLPCKATKDSNVTGLSVCYFQSGDRDNLPLLPDSIQILSLRDSYLKTIQDQFFSNVSHLDLLYLDLDMAGIEDIQPGAFRWFRSLTSLSLRKKQLDSECNTRSDNRPWLEFA
jgi:hypothetical protein